jgi:type I restriction enzyme S subunit
MVLKNCYERYRFSDYFKTDLPEHWTEKRLGYLAKEEQAAFVDGPFGSDLKTSDYKDDGVPLIQLNNIRDSKHLMQNMKFVTEDKKQQLIRHLAIPGDVVIAKMAEPVARAAIVKDDYSEYLIVADCVKFTPNLDLVDLRYLVWSINCDHVRINAELVATGTTRIRINLGELKKLKIPYPPFLEQGAIANFLDHETAKIDILIEKQQQLIKLLKEKRQAVISHAVTKGLNPNAPMRDSGVEWLGEVPDHWQVVPLKYLCCLLKDGTHLPPPRVDFGIPLLSVRNIVNNKLIFRDDDSNISKEDYKNLCKPFIPRQGDVLLAIVGATLGKVAIVEEMSEFHIQRSLAIFRAQPDSMTSEGLANIFGSTNFQSLLWENVGFSAQPGIYLGALENFQLPVPPLGEQNEINEYCKSKAERISILILKAESAIELMQERRTALISAAVTGKIDVRNWQAPEYLHSNEETA